MEEKNKKSILMRVLAWIGLVIITILLFVIAYAMMTHNGRLALAFIIGLMFISIVFWVIMKLYKDAEEYKALQNKEYERKKMNDIASQNTKNI